MKPAFTYSEIRETERTIIEKEGIPSLVLMENAGKNAYDVITSLYTDLKNESVVIVCGKGNNAGDGFVIARHFVINSIPVTLYNFSSPGELKGDALVNYDILQKLSSGICSISNVTEDNFETFSKSLKKIKGNGIIIDALLGSGVKGKVKGLYEKVILEVNKLKRKNHSVDVISIDVPSGLSDDVSDGAVIEACHTVTMGAVKTNLLYGRGKENTGNLHVVPIGIPAGMLERFSADTKHIVEISDVRKRFPVRKKTSYKYSNGKVLVIGGSKGLSGAILMSSLSALKSGAGAVLAAFPESISAHFSRKLYEVIKTELPCAADGSISENAFEEMASPLKKADAVLIGPGISLSSSAAVFTKRFIQECGKPMVIDADALTIVAGDIEMLNRRKPGTDVILTPHLGEFSRLSGLSTDEIRRDMFRSVRNFAQKYDVNVVLKSETSFACTPTGEIFLNSTGNEQLASAGTGDVLSGTIASLLAQSASAETAMICGNYLHGMLADIYFDKHGNKQSASVQELIKLLSEAISRILE